MLGDLPPHLVQLRPRLQMDIDGLAAHPAGQVVLRPVPPVTRPRARAVRLPAPAPHRVQCAPPEVAGLRHQAEQLRTAALQPGQVTTGQVSHGTTSKLSGNITQGSPVTCASQTPSQLSRAPQTSGYVRL